MNHEQTQPSRNASTYGSADVMIVDCEVQYPPFESSPDQTLPSTIPAETVRLVLNLAAESLPDDEKALIKLFLDGKTKHEVAASLGIPFPDLYYRWRGAYLRTRAFLESHASIDADVKHCALVTVSSFLNGKN